MTTGVARVAVAAMVAWLAGGCAYNDHYDNRVSTYDVASEKARDQMILTNVIRASRAEPLAFLQMGKVTGVASSSGQLGLPSLVIGPTSATPGTSAASAATYYLDHQAVFGANPAASGYAPNSVTMSGSTTFDVTPAETKDFYRGLLLSVEPETLAFFSEQGVASELLFYLFTEKVVEQRGGKVAQYVNDPLDPNFEHFQRYVALAMTYGLTAEPQPGAKPPKPSKPDAGDSNAADNGQGQDWRLCFDRSAWGPGTKFADNHPLCGSKEKTTNPRVVSFRAANGELVKLHVFPRSTFGIFQYLGRIVAAGDQGRIALTTPQAYGRPPLEDHTLFSVTAGAGGDCFLSVDYGHGYCVPQEALNTKRVLGLLAQLLALNTSVRDISITPEVRLIQ